ncbi:recombinase family protein [Frankia sp. AiPs1]|uniref:recombinase family protein n=1 Tax=Frankia sp. AiPs1 TaxID=573493 RepID=UPI0020439AF9|nr:recombinase family protein [Frankia sp. AiPs1]MCM3920615.1 recombinase family protein [Frankia sp. AiPs1]
MTTARPAAFGYIAVQHADEAEIEQFHDQLMAYAESHELVVIEIYVDRRIIPGSLLRPGFDSLVGELKRHSQSRVLVPTADHLSPAPSVRAAFLAVLTELGAALVVAS